MGRLCLLSGQSHLSLAQAVAEALAVRLGKMELWRFANGEIGCRLDESVRGADVFVIQTHGGPDINSAIMEQAIMVDTAKRASTASVTAVCPFFGYARQDRQAIGREPITARLVVDILAAAGADRIMSIDLHTDQIQGFFNGPFDHLTARRLLTRHIQANFKRDDLVVVSPDAGRVKSAERYSSQLGCAMAIVHKHRSETKRNSVEAKYLIGDVKGKACLVVDDMIDTAATLCAAADLLKEHGAKTIYGLATHGVFSGPALERINASAFSQVAITNTLPMPAGKHSKLTVLSIAPMLAKAIGAVSR